jgi:hypothetical protein
MGGKRRSGIRSGDPGHQALVTSALISVWPRVLGSRTDADTVMTVVGAALTDPPGWNGAVQLLRHMGGQLCDQRLLSILRDQQGQPGRILSILTVAHRYPDGKRRAYSHRHTLR